MAKESKRAILERLAKKVWPDVVRVYFVPRKGWYAERQSGQVEFIEANYFEALQWLEGQIS